MCCQAVLPDVNAFLRLFHIRDIWNMPQFNIVIKLFFTVVVFVGANILHIATDGDGSQDNVQSVRQQKADTEQNQSLEGTIKAIGGYTVQIIAIFSSCSPSPLTESRINRSRPQQIADIPQTVRIYPSLPNARPRLKALYNSGENADGKAAFHVFLAWRYRNPQPTTAGLIPRIHHGLIIYTSSHGTSDGTALSRTGISFSAFSAVFAISGQCVLHTNSNLNHG